MRYQLKVLMVALCGVLLAGISHAEDEWKRDLCLPSTFENGVREEILEWDAGEIYLGETQEGDHFVGAGRAAPFFKAWTCIRATSIPTRTWIGASTAGNPDLPEVYAPNGRKLNFFVVEDASGNDLAAYAANFQGTIKYSTYEQDEVYGGPRFPSSEQGMRASENGGFEVYDEEGRVWTFPNKGASDGQQPVSFQPAITIDFPAMSTYGIYVNHNIRMGVVNGSRPEPMGLQFSALQFVIYQESAESASGGAWDESKYNWGFLSRPTVAFAPPTTTAFGMRIGQTTEEQAKNLYAVTYAGVNLYSNGNMYDLDVKNIGLDRLKDLRIVFDEGSKLVAVIATFDKSKKNEIFSYLLEKYQLVSSEMPRVGNMRADFVDGSTKISMNAPHLSFDLTVLYSHESFDTAFNEYKRNQGIEKRNKLDSLL